MTPWSCDEARWRSSPVNASALMCLVEALLLSTEGPLFSPGPLWTTSLQRGHRAPVFVALPSHPPFRAGSPRGITANCALNWPPWLLGHQPAARSRWCPLLPDPPLPSPRGSHLHGRAEASPSVYQREDGTPGGRPCPGGAGRGLGRPAAGSTWSSPPVAGSALPQLLVLTPAVMAFVPGCSG